MTDEHDENKQSRMKGLTQGQEKEHEHEHEHENEHEQECEHQDSRWLKRVRCSRTRRVFAAREKAGLSYGEHTSARAHTHARMWHTKRKRTGNCRRTTWTARKNEGLVVVCLPYCWECRIGKHRWTRSLPGSLSSFGSQPVDSSRCTFSFTFSSHYVSTSQVKRTTHNHSIRYIDAQVQGRDDTNITKRRGCRVGGPRWRATVRYGLPLSVLKSQYRQNTATGPANIRELEPHTSVNSNKLTLRDKGSLCYAGIRTGCRWLLPAHTK